MTNHGEATDLTLVSNDGDVIGVAVSGHKSIDKGIDGSVTMLDMDGEILWNKNYGNPVGGIHEYAGLDGGNPKLIFDECWGIQPTDHGSIILACGTGIEGCAGHGISCRQDPRNKWRGFLMEIDSGARPRNWGRGRATENERIANENERIFN